MKSCWGFLCHVEMEGTYWRVVCLLWVESVCIDCDDDQLYRAGWGGEVVHNDLLAVLVCTQVGQAAGPVQIPNAVQGHWNSAHECRW